MPPKKKKIAAVVRIQLKAGAATPAPPVGTVLGPHGVNIMDFCKAYNASTESQRGQVIPAEITIYEDRTFSFMLEDLAGRGPDQDALPASRRAAASRTLKKVGRITRTQARDIAQAKMADLNARDLDAAEKIIAGTARSMGVDVVEG